MKICAADRLSYAVYSMEPPCDFVVSYSTPPKFHPFFTQERAPVPRSPLLADLSDDPAWKKKWEDRQLIVYALDIEKTKSDNYGGVKIVLEPPSIDQVAQIFDHAARFAPAGRAPSFVVNCWAGVSRSTATGLALMASFSPHRRAGDLVDDLLALCPFAVPNRAILAHADRLLDRAREDSLLEAVDVHPFIRARREDLGLCPAGFDDRLKL